MKKINYYLNKLFCFIKNNFKYAKVKRFGLAISIYGFLAFFMHRNDSRIEHWLVRGKDRIVKKFVYKEYGDIIGQYSSGSKKEDIP